MIWTEASQRDVETLVCREWLVTNGLGGYASGSISGISTRRYHGLLIAALGEPHGRTVMLNHVSEELRLPGGQVVPLGGHALADGTLELHGISSLASFRLELGLPVWQYRAGGFLIERRIVMPHQLNTTVQTYRVLEGEGTVRLRLRPSIQFRPHEAPVADHSTVEYRVTHLRHGCEISEPAFPPLRLCMRGRPSALVLDGGQTRHVYYQIEAGPGLRAFSNLVESGLFSDRSACRRRSDARGEYRALADRVGLYARGLAGPKGSVVID